MLTCEDCWHSRLQLWHLHVHQILQNTWEHSSAPVTTPKYLWLDTYAALGSSGPIERMWTCASWEIETFRAWALIEISPIINTQSICSRMSHCPSLSYQMFLTSILTLHPCIHDDPTCKGKLHKKCFASLNPGQGWSSQYSVNGKHFLFQFYV